MYFEYNLLNLWWLYLQGFEFWEWRNWIYITKSNHNSWATVNINSVQRKWYNWQILLDSNYWSKVINIECYITDQDVNNLYDKVNLFKKALNISNTLWKVPELKLYENWNIIRYKAILQNFDSITEQIWWEINKFNFSLSFLVPDWYWLWDVLSKTFNITDNFNFDIKSDFASNKSTAETQPIIRIKFNEVFVWDLSMTFKNDTYEDKLYLGNLNISANQFIRINLVSWEIWANHLDSSLNLIKELDPNWTFPRWLAVNDDTNIEFHFFGDDIDAQILFLFEERFI